MKTVRPLDYNTYQSIDSLPAVGRHSQRFGTLDAKPSQPGGTGKARWAPRAPTQADKGNVRDNGITLNPQNPAVHALIASGGVDHQQATCKKHASPVPRPGFLFLAHLHNYEYRMQQQSVMLMLQRAAVWFRISKGSA